MIQDKLNLNITPELVKQNSTGKYVDCYLSNNGYTRQAKLYEDGKIVLERGAYLEDLTESGKELGTIINLRKTLRDSIKNNRTTIDLIFKTPSSAASFCCGSNRNGWGNISNSAIQGFRNADGHAIDLYRVEKDEAQKYLKEASKNEASDVNVHFKLVTSQTLFAEYNKQGKFISICIKENKFILLSDTPETDTELYAVYNTFEELCESFNIEKSTKGWTTDTGRSLGEYLKLIESKDNNKKDTKEKEEDTKENKEAMKEKEEQFKKYSLEDFDKAVQGVDADTLVKILKVKKALLLVSPPGTGKTTTARELAKYIVGEDNPNKYKLVSFSQTTSYSDIIGGYQNIGVDGKENWQVVKGSLTAFCDKAASDIDNKYVYIIDEINRANTESVLGEAITALEQRDIAVDTNAKFSLTIPNNVYILATMNSADESITDLDTALLDRFAVYNMPSIKLEANKIKSTTNENLLKAMDLVLEAIKNINLILEKDVYKGKENRIGNRALFTDYNSIEELGIVIEYDLEPKIETKLKSLENEQQREVRSILKNLKDQIKNT